MRVHWIWIDPGETVGWAQGYADADNINVVATGNTKLKTFALALLRSAAEDNDRPYDVIGYESYTIRPDKLRAHAGSTVPTLQLVGMIRLAGWVTQAHRTVAILNQAPAAKTKGRGAARVYLPDWTEQIDEALEGAHDDGHWADAVMHAAAWYHDTLRGGA